jgi:hypothetical protein
VEVADQFEKIWLFLYHDGLVPVLEEVPLPVMPPVKRAGVPSEEGAHGSGERAVARAD